MSSRCVLKRWPRAARWAAPASPARMASVMRRCSTMDFGQLAAQTQRQHPGPVHLVVDGLHDAGDAAVARALDQGP